MCGIIVGVDSSGHSGHVLGWAAREAVLRQVPLTVLAVHQPVIAYLGSTVDRDRDNAATEHARGLARELVEKVLDSLEAAPPQVTVRSVSGFPAEELLKASKDADMLVVGSRSAGSFARLLMGSVSYQVAQHAQCPVAIVPSRDRS
jgi:nucleotide-binding universal stress UspA family protein